MTSSHYQALFAGVLLACCLVIGSARPTGVTRGRINSGLRSPRTTESRGRLAMAAKGLSRDLALSKKPTLAASEPSNSGRRHALAPLRSTVETETPAPAKTGDDKNIVVIPEDYRLGGALLGVAFLLGPALHLWKEAFFHAVIGAFLTYQTTRVRFRFSDGDLDVVFVDGENAAESLGTESSGENYLQGGGENKWSFKSVTNWEMWWPGFPLLVYFKENQTKSTGQPHFFPIIMDGKKLYEQMKAKMGPSVNPKPPVDDWNLDTALESTPVGRRIKEELGEDVKAKLKDVKEFQDILKLIQN